jgi:hypothetical protein
MEDVVQRMNHLGWKSCPNGGCRSAMVGVYDLSEKKKEEESKEIESTRLFTLVG